MMGMIFFIMNRRIEWDPFSLMIVANESSIFVGNLSAVFGGQPKPQLRFEKGINHQ